MCWSSAPWCETLSFCRRWAARLCGFVQFRPTLHAPEHRDGPADRQPIAGARHSPHLRQDRALVRLLHHAGQRRALALAQWRGQPTARLRHRTQHPVVPALDAAFMGLAAHGGVAAVHHSHKKNSCLRMCYLDFTHKKHRNQINTSASSFFFESDYRVLWPHTARCGRRVGSQKYS